MNIFECLKQANEILEGDEERVIDSKILLEHVLGVDRAKLLLMYNDEIKTKDYKKFIKMVKLRAKHIPIAYILHQKEFKGLNFYVNPNVLIPRDDTEVLVNEAISYIRNFDDTKSVIDMCTGSGCIAVSLAKNLKNINLTAADVSTKALNVARKNAVINDVTDRIKFIKSDLFSKFSKNEKDKYDLIISNPPYIMTKVIDTLDEDVKNNEPHLALDGGEDGFDFYRRIVDEAKAFLKDGGVLMLEIDYTYTEKMIKILKSKIYNNIKVIKDISGKDRVITAVNVK